jgi:molecular chaperone DnaJ
VPHLRRAGVRGDLHVLVDVKVPTRLTKRQRDLLAEFADETGEASDGRPDRGIFDRVKDAIS